MKTTLSEQVDMRPNGQVSPDVRALVGLPPPPPNQRRMYAITFDLDTDMLQQLYPGDSWRNAYTDIRRILIEDGFDWQQDRSISEIRNASIP